MLLCYIFENLYIPNFLYIYYFNFFTALIIFAYNSDGIFVVSPFIRKSDIQHQDRFTTADTLFHPLLFCAFATFVLFAALRTLQTARFLAATKFQSSAGN